MNPGRSSKPRQKQVTVVAGFLTNPMVGVPVWLAAVELLHQIMGGGQGSPWGYISPGGLSTKIG